MTYFRKPVHKQPHANLSAGSQQTALSIDNQGDQNQAQDSHFYTTWYPSNGHKKGI